MNKLEQKFRDEMLRRSRQEPTVNGWDIACMIAGVVVLGTFLLYLGVIVDTFISLVDLV